MDIIKIGLTGKWCEDFEKITPHPEQLPTVAFREYSINIRVPPNRRIT
jgi:hypothetical protein